MMDQMAFILTNFSSDASARSVSRILMQEKMITSVNIFRPHFSLYPYDGKLLEEPEVSAVFKTSVKNKAALVKRLRHLHPYDLPSIIVMGAEANADYVAWLNNPNGYKSSDKE